MPLEGVAAREPTPVWGLCSARAWAPPGESEVAYTVFYALMRVLEGREAGANAAI